MIIKINIIKFKIYLDLNYNETKLQFSDRWVQRNGEESSLPGLDLTPIQLFWVGAANTWCSKYRPKSLEMRIRTGAHAPGQFRVKGPFSNSKEFSKDFNCPLGSPMNPVSKCEVW